MERILQQNIIACIKDIEQISTMETVDHSFVLDALERGYDLYDRLFEIKDNQMIIGSEFLQDGTADAFLEVYSSNVEKLQQCIEISALRQTLSEKLTALDRLVEEAENEVVRVTELHQQAKITLEIWETKGFFARRKALRLLRKMAKFPLEKGRIGNYVARTFDLMNQARMEFAKAQQTRFKADISYKIDPDIYSKLAELLQNYFEG